MKALARGFLAGFGFALGASVAGTLIGYTIGRIGEASVKRLLSPERTSSPARSSSQPSSEQSDTDKTQETICDEHKATYFYSGYDAGIKDGSDEHKSDPDDRPCSYCGEHHPGDPRHEVPDSDEPIKHSPGSANVLPGIECDSHYGVPLAGCPNDGFTCPDHPGVTHHNAESHYDARPDCSSKCSTDTGHDPRCPRAAPVDTEDGTVLP